jgi:hypothetical protein
MEQTHTAAAGQPRIDHRALTPPTAGAERAANLLVLLVLALALGLGWGLKVYVESRSATFSDQTVTFPYPATWVLDRDDDDNPMVRDPNAGPALFTNRLVVIHSPAPKSTLPGSSPLADAATAWSLKRAIALSTFRNLATLDRDPTTDQPLTVAGQPAIRIDYAYVAEPGAALGQTGQPIVVRGSDYVVLNGDQLTVLSGQANAEQWQAFERQLHKIIAGVQPAQGGS